MKTPDFLKQLDHARIVAAVREAENGTSGEIRVFVSHKAVEAPVSTAQAHFLRLGMHKTNLRNGVLIFVAPLSQTFAIIGDQGVHEKCGDDFWLQVSADMKAHFRNSQFTDGIVGAVARAGALLGQHFPRRGDDSNELPDEVAHD